MSELDNELTPSAPQPPTEGQSLYPRVGFKVGEYTIEDILGQGAMSTVFLCRDATGHTVALKVFTDTGSIPDKKLQRFEREINLSKELRDHPNIMTVYATGQDGPYRYIAMAHLPASRTLEQLISREHLSAEQVARIGVKLCRALAYAHAHGVVHRDVKPANVLIDQFGEPILADLGVAALLDAPAMTVPGSLTGTPLYMSPEQAQGGRATPSSDVYSLGVTLYEALTGVLPFSSHHCGSIKETLKAVRDEPPRRPSAFREGLSPDLEAVILKALAKRPEDRYADAEAFARDLEHFLKGQTVEAGRVSRLRALRGRLRRYRRVIAALAVLALAAWLAWMMVLSALKDAQYSELVSLARLQSAQRSLARLGMGEISARGAMRAMQEIHLQRQVMAEDRWGDALQGLEAAVQMADAAHAPEVAAAARIEQARCAVMLEDYEQGALRYGSLLRDDALPAAAARLARFEHALLALLTGGRSALLDAIAAFPPEDAEGLDAVLRWLGQGASSGEIAARAPSLPPQYVNDGWFAAVLVARAEGQRDAARQYLRECLAASRFSTDWPAPFADRMRRELGATDGNRGAGP